MAQDKQTAEASDDGDFLPEPPAPMVVEESGDALAEGIEALQAQSLDSTEVSRQLEDLTGVVLSSAEVSTRSAEVAANITSARSEFNRIMIGCVSGSPMRQLNSSVLGCPWASIIRPA